MKELNLRQEYTRIRHEGKLSYGANQNWFGNVKKLSREHILQKWGCGVIAVADVMQYLAKADPHFSTPVTALAGREGAPLDWEKYRGYISYLNAMYIPLLNGTHGIVLASAMQRYALKYRLPIRCAWKVFTDEKVMLKAIRKMLSDNLPVILSVGPGTKTPLQKSGVPFYIRKDNGLEEPEFRPSLNKNVHAHFVTVTGIVWLKHKRIMLRLSSWGEDYYMDYAEYRKYIREHGDCFTSSMLYMERR